MHYCAGADLATSRAAPLLARSRAYLSVGHDEYWTYAQRAAIEAARDRPRGLHLNFWSANEAYWAVRLERSRYDAADAAEEEEPPRTLVCYKEAQSVAKLDPLPDEWTGTFRDARPINPRGAMPENALTGTMFAANAQRHDPLIVDGARFGRHRAWRGTAARAQADEISPYISPVSPCIPLYLPISPYISPGGRGGRERSSTPAAGAHGGPAWARVG